MGRQADANAVVPLPVRDGLAPSYAWLPDGAWPNLLAFLIDHFPDVTEQVWRERMARGDVVDGAGRAQQPDSPVQRGGRIWYYREVPFETPIPFEEQVLYRDEHIVVVDKPHFLPMTPGGRFVHETLLVRLKAKLDLPHLTPIHRLDRETAGVVIFSHCVETRGAYQSLFQKRAIEKTYEALAPPMAGRSFPFVHRSRMVDGDKFFVMREEAGEPNSETLIDVIEARGEYVLYRLQPHTGRKHQLRVHMAGLGAPIVNDAFYPVTLACKGDDWDHPLKLLARAIAFDDPLSGVRREFCSKRSL